MLPLQFGLIEDGLNQFVQDMAGSIPQILSGIVFLVFAAVLAKLVMIVLRAVLRRALPDDSDVYRRFISGIVAAFLWFSIGLSFLTIVGLEGIASSLGTAAGFLALGVSYSLSNMIADAVAGVYLLRDPDFMPGDRVKVGDVSGTVTSIELRKTRFRDENDDTVVRGNAEIEKKWTKLEDGEAVDPAEGGDGPGDEDVLSAKIDDQVEEQAAETADEAADEATEAADDATDEATETADDATDEATEAADDATDEATETADDATDELADDVWSDATDSSDG